MSNTTQSERLTIVIVHRDQPERCVRTARAFLDQNVPVRLLVVDNGSRAAARRHVASELPEVELVALGANTGFGPGANTGLRRFLEEGTGEWVAVAPHDVLPEPGCLPKLLDAVRRRPRAGLASAEFGDTSTPVVDPYFGGIMLPGRPEPGWQDAGFPHGSLMLARRACLDDIGLFDERYFAYCEEADLGVRAREAGWEVGIVRGAVVRNTSLSSSVATVEYLQLRNSLLLVRSHFGRYRTVIRLLMAFGNTARHLAVPWRRPPVFDARARVRAVADFLHGRFGPPPPSLQGSRS